jgi:steroid delta-isomerase-like uncharacterized protein
METPKEVVLAWVDAFNRRDAHAAAALYHDDAVNLQVPHGTPVVGRTAMLDAFTKIMGAFPDSSTRTVNLFVDGEWVILECEFGGTWRGQLAGHEPNGRTFKVQGCEFFQVVDGKITCQRGYWDKATWFGQLGIALERTP